MERKAHNSLYEAALQVQLGDSLDESSRERRKEIVNKIHGGPTQKPLETATKAERGDYRDMSSSLGHDSGEFGPDDKLIKHVKDYYAGKHDNVPTQQEIVRANRLGRKSKEATSARKKKLTRKKLYPKSGLKGEKKTFTDKLFNHVEYDEVDSMVLEYFSNYFGDNLNEDTSDEDIMDAVYDLIDLTEAVLEKVMGGWNKPLVSPFAKGIPGAPGMRGDAWTANQSQKLDRIGRAAYDAHKNRYNLGSKIGMSKPSATWSRPSAAKPQISDQMMKSMKSKKYHPMNYPKSMKSEKMKSHMPKDVPKDVPKE